MFLSPICRNYQFGARRRYDAGWSLLFSLAEVVEAGCLLLPAQKSFLQKAARLFFHGAGLHCVPQPVTGVYFPAGKVSF
jgi:hypothetical protein